MGGALCCMGGGRAPCRRCVLDARVSLAPGTAKGRPPRRSRSFTCILPKDALVEGVMERVASRPVALMKTSDLFVAPLANHCLAIALPAYVDERQRGFMWGRPGIDHVSHLELLALVSWFLWGPSG